MGQPQFGDVVSVEPKEKPIPIENPALKTEAMGIIKADDMKIFIHQKVLEQIVAYSNTNLSAELGGMMVGDFYSCRGIPFIEIEAYIESDLGGSRVASFTFNHDSWSKVNKAMDEKYADKIKVGWHHTHPGYGIFLSSYDMFIQHNFFNLPWMTALVVDPRAESMGFFQWKAGHVVPCGFYLIRA